MAYTSKTWTDFDAEYPTRYKITHSDLTEEQVRIANDFGQCTEGDVFDASTMNNLESRIASAFSDDADAIEDASGLNFAEEYDDTSTYTVNDYCVHEGLLYKCISTISTAEAWTPAHWSRVYATDEIAGASSLQGLSDVNISSPTNGQALVYDATSSKWVNGAGGGGSSASGVYIGTCATAGNQSAKQVTVSSDQNFVLEKGTTICVKFANTNSVSNVTISVNNGTAYPIYYGTSAYTASWSMVTGASNREFLYIFNGSYWVWQSCSYIPSYGSITDAEAEAGTSTTDKMIKPTVLKHAIQYHAIPQVDGNERIVGKLGNDTLYERVFTFSYSDMQGGSRDSSRITGVFVLDSHEDYKNIMIHEAQIVNTAPNNAFNVWSMPLPIASASGLYCRVQIQKSYSEPAAYDGVPFIYFDSTYNAAQILDNNNLLYIFTIRYTKVTL